MTKSVNESQRALHIETIDDRAGRLSICTKVVCSVLQNPPPPPPQ